MHMLREIVFGMIGWIEISQVGVEISQVGAEISQVGVEGQRWWLNVSKDFS
jgi:hypothetical protein